MKAIRMRRTGRPAVLKLEDVGAPRPRPGEALVEVRYASVNPVDTKIRRGEFPAYTAPLPAILGRDISGIVRSVGLGAGRRRPAFAEGTEVFGMLDYERGAYAEYAVGSGRELAPVPKGLGLREAAALPVAGLTAWQGLFTHGKLRRGQRVLIHGGGGGVGHLAVQLARVRGAEVVVTARAKDAGWLRRLGAHQVIELERERFEEKVADVDLVFDLVGGEVRERSSGVLKRRSGRIVSTVGPGHMVVKADRDQLEEIAALAKGGKVKPAIAEEFPLARARIAHERLEAGGVRGKLLLVTDAAL